MINPRRYGRSPYTVALVHGGPGAAGEMEPVARVLAARHGVIEPLQTAASAQGQAEELRALLEAAGDPPFALVGFSWGAWLCIIAAATFPSIARKLVLVGCGPLEAAYAERIETTRLGRLEEGERIEYESALDTLRDPAAPGKPAAFERLGELASKTDAFDPIPGETVYGVPARPNLFHGVLAEAQAMRRSGELLRLAARIESPVVAIHGDYDPHPAEGVELPLGSRLNDFRFILLEHCGHKPWIERRARDDFYDILERELG